MKTAGFFWKSKKYKGIVYKRRLALPADQAKAYLEEGRKPEEQNQIFRKIDYFIKFYHPVPRVYLSESGFTGRKWNYDFRKR